MSDTKGNDFEARLREVRLVTSASLDRRVRESMRDTLATQQDPTGAQAPDKEDKPMTVESTIDARSQGSPHTLHIPRRLAKAAGVAAAAAVVLAGMFWLLTTGGPKATLSAYAALAEVVKNSRAAEWVHYKIDSPNHKSEHWFSFQPFRMALKMDDRVLFVDSGKEMRWYYNVDARTLTVDSITGQTEIPDKAQNLFSMTMTMVEAATAKGAKLTRSAETIDGKACDVYTFLKAEGDPPARFIVEASSQRIVRVEVLHGDAGPAMQVDLDYPAAGPEDVYAVGVPRDAKIVKGTYLETMALKTKVEAARSAFAPAYFAVIVTTSSPSGAAAAGNLTDIAAVYRKANRYRIEQYAESPEKLAAACPSMDLASIEKWISAQASTSVYFADSARENDPQMPRPGATWFSIDRRGGLLRKRQVWQTWKEFTVEGRTWADTMPVTIATAETQIVPDKDGASGALTGAEFTGSGVVVNGTITGYPQKIRWYFSPARDYVAEESGIVRDANASWQARRDWLAGANADAAAKNYQSTEMRRVAAYAQTPAGQWYAKEITTDTRDSRTGANAHRTVILLDTTRELPDDLFDETMFEAQHQAATK